MPHIPIFRSIRLSIPFLLLISIKFKKILRLTKNVFCIFFFMILIFLFSSIINLFNFGCRFIIFFRGIFCRLFNIVLGLCFLLFLGLKNIFSFIFFIYFNKFYYPNLCFFPWHFFNQINPNFSFFEFRFFYYTFFPILYIYILIFILNYLITLLFAIPEI